MLKTGYFSDSLKFADITLIFKKKNPLRKVNYGPVTVFPSTFNFLSPYFCGYKKGFSSQQVLLPLIENWKKGLDKKDFGGTVLMDLYKAFDTMKHDLPIGKLYTYGFNKESLKLFHSYLTDRWHRIIRVDSKSAARICSWPSSFLYLSK